MKEICLWILFSIGVTRSLAQCACCAGAGIGSSNGEFNYNFSNLQKGAGMVEMYGDYRTIQNGDAPEEDEKLLENMFVGSFGLRFGLTNRIVISALAPHVSLHTGTGNDGGWGDLILMGAFKVLSKRDFNAVIQTGIELPTGVQKSSGFDNTTVVVGSGSYDPMLGVYLSKKWNNFALQFNGLYKFTTNGFQGNYYGSLSLQNISLAYRLGADNSDCSSNNTSKDFNERPSISVFGGYYGEWLDKLKEDGVVDEDSGYYLGFATGGTNISWKKWSFPLTMSVPFINRVNGQQNNAGFRIRTGIVRLF